MEFFVQGGCLLIVVLVTRTSRTPPSIPLAPVRVTLFPCCHERKRICRRCQSLAFAGMKGKVYTWSFLIFSASPLIDILLSSHVSAFARSIRNRGCALRDR